MPNFLEVYGEAGAVGIICVMFILMIKNLMSSQTSQNEDLDDIRKHIAIMETKIANSEGIIIKLISRWDKSDGVRDIRHEKLVSEINDLGDVMMEVKGSLSRINGKH
tara:strand:- start:16395 stop:16715 length:321 start_codon:yes stop_codon:yes gene_type:complete